MLSRSHPRNCVWHDVQKTSTQAHCTHLAASSLVACWFACVAPLPLLDDDGEASTSPSSSPPSLGMLEAAALADEAGSTSSMGMPSKRRAAAVMERRAKLLPHIAITATVNIPTATKSRINSQYIVPTAARVCVANHATMLASPHGVATTHSKAPKTSPPMMTSTCSP